jgi:hypothetical protein
MESTIYTVNGKEFELQHYGVKGMKWGRRKARPQSTGSGRRGGQATNDSPEAQAARKEARRAKAKRAAKVGAALVGTALAVYGAKKLHDVVRDKNEAIKLRKANKLIDEMIRGGTWYTPIGTSAATRAKIDKNFENYVTGTFGAARRDAARDSFATATRNVVNDYLDNRRRR